jgi:hypothetical protein
MSFALLNDIHIIVILDDQTDEQLPEPLTLLAFHPHAQNIASSMMTIDE